MPKTDLVSLLNRCGGRAERLDVPCCTNDRTRPPALLSVLAPVAVQGGAEAARENTERYLRANKKALCDRLGATEFERALRDTGVVSPDRKRGKARTGCAKPRRPTSAVR